LGIDDYYPANGLYMSSDSQVVHLFLAAA
jgi:hypothetical protein